MKNHLKLNRIHERLCSIFDDATLTLLGKGVFQKGRYWESAEVYSMSELIFSDRPHIELLQWLARGSLKQNLPRAARLWVLLITLYGDDTHRLKLDDFFTFAEWRKAFFSRTHPQGEAIPDLHDPDCACAKTTADWIFDPQLGVSQSE
jgi:hypothetical protein